MLKNIIANFVGRFWGILSGFLFIPLYIHYLGFESYSVISFALVLTGLMAVLDAGLSATLSREFARTDQSGNEKVKTFKTLETVYLILVSFAILIVFSFSGLIADKWLKLSSFRPAEISFFLKVISFDIGFQLLLRFYMGGLLGLEQQVKANILLVFWGMLRNGLVIAPMIFKPDLTLFFIWQAVSTLLFTVLMRAALSHKLFGAWKITKPVMEKEVLQNTWQFAGGMLLISLVAALNSQMDKLAISKLLSLESLGYYTLAVSLASGLVVLVNPVSVASLPRFTFLYSEGKNKEAASLFQKINTAVSVIVFSVMANIIFFRKELIWLWTGKMELAENSGNILAVLAVSYAMLSYVMIAYNIAIANGYTKLNNVLGIFSLFLTLPGYWAITGYYGAEGAALVFCMVQTIITVVYIYFINKKYLKIKLSNIYFRELFLPLCISLVIAFGMYSVPHFYSESRFFSFIAVGVSTTITFMITGMLLISRRDLSFYLQLKSNLFKQNTK